MGPERLWEIRGDLAEIRPCFERLLDRGVQGKKMTTGPMDPGREHLQLHPRMFLNEGLLDTVAVPFSF